MIEPHLTDELVTLYHGDCLDVLRELPDASVDAVVTDPPYGLADHAPAVVAQALGAWLAGDRDHVPDGRGFMGRRWDRFVPPPAVFDECLRVLKPGGHLLCFAGSRTHDLMATSIRFAGFEIRDGIAWLYGSGFPKSLDVSKAIDKALGAERSKVRVDATEVRNPKAIGGGRDGTEGATRPWIEAALANGFHEKEGDEPVTDEAASWQGWGTALKPAFEPVVVARKPLAGTVAANVLEHGTGGLNIDGCRIGDDVVGWGGGAAGGQTWNDTNMGLGKCGEARPIVGRWPANVVLDESQAAELDQQSGELTSGANPTRRRADKFRDAYGDFQGQEECKPARGADAGGASRFFYVAKAPSSERVRLDGVAHPTVKPLDLMRWLVRLVTPPGGTVLEPFAGSGTTVEACVLEGVSCIAIEREADYLPLIRRRILRRTDTIAVALEEKEDLGLLADMLGLNEEAAGA